MFESLNHLYELLTTQPITTKICTFVFISVESLFRQI